MPCLSSSRVGDVLFPFFSHFQAAKKATQKAQAAAIAAERATRRAVRQAAERLHRRPQRWMIQVPRAEAGTRTLGDPTDREVGMQAAGVIPHGAQRRARRDPLGAIVQRTHPVRLQPLHVACADPNRKSNRTGVLVNLIPFNPGDGQGGGDGGEAREVVCGAVGGAAGRGAGGAQPEAGRLTQAPCREDFGGLQNSTKLYTKNS